MGIFNTFDNAFGGEHYSSHSNNVGGEDIYGDGHVVETSQNNILGGKNILHKGHIVKTTMLPNSLDSM